MTWYQNVFELIDMRSFSNLWFWIALAVMWSTISHWVLGVPWDMALQARKDPDGERTKDFEDLVRIYTNRILFIAQTSGLLIVGFSCFALTVAVLMGFVYHLQFAQAVFLMGFPMGLVAMLSVLTAREIKNQNLQGEDLYKRMYRHRLVTQVIGIFFVTVTSLWGMIQNFTTGALGG